MTFLFIALKPSRPFIARITFKVFLFLKLFIVLPFGIFNTVVVFREKKGKLRIMSCLESFKMITNDVIKFLLFSIHLAISWFKLFILKKSRFFEDLLFYPKNNKKYNEIESAMFMFTLSLTR